eukprot:12928049-Prorocentrum_lima.AAC.1
MCKESSPRPESPGREQLEHIHGDFVKRCGLAVIHCMKAPTEKRVPQPRQKHNIMPDVCDLPGRRVRGIIGGGGT